MFTIIPANKVAQHKLTVLWVIWFLKKSYKPYRMIQHCYWVKHPVTLIKPNARVVHWYYYNCSVLSPGSSRCGYVLLHRRVIPSALHFTNKNATMHFAQSLCNWHARSAETVMISGSLSLMLKHISECTQNFEGDWVLPMSKYKTWATSAVQQNQ